MYRETFTIRSSQIGPDVPKEAMYHSTDATDAPKTAAVSAADETSAIETLWRTVLLQKCLGRTHLSSYRLRPHLALCCCLSCEILPPSFPEKQRRALQVR